MPSLSEILNDPNYLNANQETKNAIFSKYAPTDENYIQANADTQGAIRSRFGVEGQEGIGPQGGFDTAVYNAYQRSKSEGAGLLGRMGLMSLDTAKQVQEEAGEKGKKAFQQSTKGWAEEPGRKFAETLGGSIPGMVLPIAAAGLATAAGAPGLIATGIGALVSYPQMVGSFLGAQQEAGTPLEDTRLASAAITAIPATAMEVLSFRMIPGVQKLFGKMGKELTQEEASAIAKQGLIRSAAAYGVQGVKSGAIEGTTEAAQEWLNRLQAGLSLGDQDAIDNYVENFIGGAAIGKTLSLPGTAMRRGAARDMAAAQPDAETTGIKPADEIVTPSDEEALVAPPSESMNTEVMIAEMEGRQLPLDVQAPENVVVPPVVEPPVATTPVVEPEVVVEPPQIIEEPSVAQPAQITQPENVQGELPAEPVSAPIPAPVAQPAQIAQPENVQPVEPGDLPENVILQNRQRSSPTSIAQMNTIANKPDYARVAFSNSFTEGAPVVFGSQSLPDTQLGRKGSIVSAKTNRKIPVQYAVVDADQLLASNAVDGSSVAEYANPAFAGFKAVTNGRVAGLKEGYTRGTMEQYKQDLINDDIHGVSANVIAGMNNPVLVRIMPKDQVTKDIADESNTSGTLSLSATEKAKNDANRIDLDGLSFREDGAISPETVKGFVAAMPQSEQQELIDNQGRPSRQAYDRLNAAIFQKAYDNDALVALAAEAKSVDAANIISGLSQAAPQMARLAEMGEYDIRPQVVQAAELAINASRQGQKLSDVIAQQELISQDSIAQQVLRLFADNTRSAKKIGEGLRRIATDVNTEATRSQEPDMFGEVPAKQPAASVVEQSARQIMIDAGYTEQDLNVLGFTKASPELQAEVAELERMLTEQGIDLESIMKDLDADLASKKITRMEHYEQAKSRFIGALKKEAEQRSVRDVSQANVPPSAAQEEVLVQPTPEDLKAKQDAADAAAKEKARAEREAVAKEKAETERKEIAARGEKAAGEFELGKSAEDDLSGQKDVFAEPVQISPDQQKIDALNKFEQTLSQVVPPFRAISSSRTVVLRPQPLTGKQIALIKDLAGEAIDLGMPASIFENVSAAGATRMSALAAISQDNGWLLLGGQWSAATRAEKLQALVHEFGHSVDNKALAGSGKKVSEESQWQKAHDELKSWYDLSGTKNTHPLNYPFNTQFKGKLNPKSESFAQAFSFYFVSPVDLQTNAPEAYSQIQSIVEGIQNESQRTSATGARKTGATGVKVQPSRATKGTEVQSETGEVGAGVSKTERVKDRDDQDVEDVDFAKQPIQQGLPGVPAKKAPAKTIKATWAAPDLTWKDSFIRKWADRNIDLKVAQREIESQVKNLRDNLNAYQIDDQSHGRIQSQTADFLDFEFRPIIQEMNKNGITDAELTKYLWMRHAPEANKVIADRNIGNPDKQDGGSGVETAVALKYVASLPADKKKKLESLAKQVDNILALTREQLEANGIITKDERQGWEDMFKHYVPLQREESDYVLPTSSYRGIGPFAKSRTGSTDKSVVDILANVAINREIAIMRMEKERVKRAIYGLAVTSPNPGFWKAVSPDAIKNRAQLAKELQSMNLDPKDIDNILNEPKKEYFNKTTGQVESRVDQQQRYADYVLPVKINGKDRFVFFNPKDERAMAMVKALKGLDVQPLGEFAATVAPITRYFAAVNTQYNLVFGLWNFARDLQGAAFNLTTTPLADKKAEVIKGAMAALPELYKEARKRNRGETPSSLADGSVQDFVAQGGRIGGRERFAEYGRSAELVEKELSKLNRNNVTKATYATLNWISSVNDTLENAVRLSAYRTALKEGMSKQKAADIAKNITVNFNRKGTAANNFGALYAFFNASVQGTARLIETVDPRTPRGRKIMTALVGLGAVQAVALAMAGFDEDEPTEFMKQKNLIIPLGDKKYFMWPMPFGLNVFPNIGRLMFEGASLAIRGKDVNDKVADVGSMLLNSFNPIGGGGLGLGMSPTAADPIVALIQNRDSFDRPIYKEDRNSSPTPGFTRSRDPSASISQFVAEMINTMTGGTSYTKGLVSPTADQINYLAEQAGGGVYREASRFYQYAKDKATGGETPEYRVPIVGKLVGSTDSPAAVSQKFYANVIKMSEHEDEIKGRIKDRGNVSEYMKKNPESSLWRRANTLENELTKINKERKRLIAQDAPKDKIKRLDDQRTRMMKQFNDTIKQRETR